MRRLSVLMVAFQLLASGWELQGLSDDGKEKVAISAGSGTGSN